MRRKPEANHINQPLDVTRAILERSKTATRKINKLQHTGAIHNWGINSDKSFSPDVPLLPYPLHKPLQKKQNVASPNDQNTEINLDIEENSPFQKDIISKSIQRPDKSFFQNPKRLKDIIDMNNLVQKFLPKQMDIDKLLHVIQRKVLKKTTNLPVEIKEIQAGYLHSPYL